MPALLNRLVDDTSGATAIEYGLIIALLCVAIIGALSSFGGSVNNMWDLISTRITVAIGV
nr:Flp family type IVb pilin [Porphyrobacter sp. GA68]